jgi:hypothetical protein
MPYILVHPLPPPKRNPYKPDLPTFTTSSRAIAHFFHSHGWRARHVYADMYAPSPSLPPSLPSQRSSCPYSLRNSTISRNGYISGTTLLSHDTPPAEKESECCRASPHSSIVACGPVVELHCYQLPLNSAIFHGPPATALQKRYLRWYAHPQSFDNADGDVDLRLPHFAALALQKDRDADFWRLERKAQRVRMRKECEGSSAGDAALREMQGGLGIQMRSSGKVARAREGPVVEEMRARRLGLGQDGKCGGRRKEGMKSVCS